MTQHVWTGNDFPWLQPITEKWESIKDYALLKDPYYIPYREKFIYKGNWSIYGLRNQMTKWTRPDNFMDPIFNLIPFKPFISTFSRLDPGVEIHPHVGFTDDVIRFHLGLVCPPNVAMCIDNVEYTWKEGEWFIFNDRKRHSVYHRGDTSRYVLIMDFYKKDIGLD